MATFKIQNSSSTVSWTGKKVLGLHTGSIDIAGGYIEFTNDNLTGGDIQIDMASIIITDIEDAKSHNDFLAHLKNDDFFSVDKYKTAKLVITNSTKQENGSYKIDGNLTIKNITHPISFIASIEIYTDYLHSKGDIVIDRTMYNIRYGSGKFIDNLGDKLIHDNFDLQFKLLGIKSN
jgi:polyisoprenoid-binding protein YceI